MKKKTSLWISGITTVAMLAVAVGSFAAWDKLTADNTPTFTATSGTPVTLAVTSDEGTFKDNTLVPENALKKASGEVTEMTATFTPTFKDADNNGEGKGAGIYAQLEPTDALSDNVKVEIYKHPKDGDRDATALSAKNITPTGGTEVTGVYELEEDMQYEVVAKFDTAKVNALTNEAAKALAGQTIATKVTCTAYQK
ncbi:hypothetical protein [Eubacterium callanderi]|uniref:hypothetical protein n=1 Tax=Eubacterium callanderi TaxID=53442 RepID=UPI0011DD375C|nr:hypothetical protein [Eubacterium callanderi]WPK78324.1 hypothetical protein EUCAG14_39210 [Eubacterium callanderi]